MSDIDPTDRSTRGAVILCGGGSQRMGRDKASLPFGDESMLARVMRLVAEAVPAEQVVLVAAKDQQLPPLPWGAPVTRDRVADQGPLPAIIAGLAALPAGVAAAFVTACDAPLLEPKFIGALFESLEPASNAIVPADGERLYPLAAVYRRGSSALLQASHAQGRGSLHAALGSEAFRLQSISTEELRQVDPELRSLMNCNTPQEYQSALALL